MTVSAVHLGDGVVDRVAISFFHSQIYVEVRGVPQVGD